MLKGGVEVTEPDMPLLERCRRLCRERVLEPCRRREREEEERCERRDDLRRTVGDSLDTVVLGLGAMAAGRAGMSAATYAAPTMRVELRVRWLRPGVMVPAGWRCAYMPSS